MCGAVASGFGSVALPRHCFRTAGGVVVSYLAEAFPCWSLPVDQDVWDSKQITSAELIFDSPGIFNVDGEAAVLLERSLTVVEAGLSSYRRVILQSEEDA